MYSYLSLIQDQTSESALEMYVGIYLVTYIVDNILFKGAHVTSHAWRSTHLDPKLKTIASSANPPVFNLNTMS
jgi:hypothetical protein